LVNLNRNQPRKRWDLTIMSFVYILKKLREQRLEKEESENILGQVIKN
jgi:hypothetical protein